MAEGPPEWFAHRQETGDEPATDLPDTEARWLLAILLQDYDLLRIKLSRRLRSTDHATDALQEVCLKLMRGPAITDVRNPRAYLYRMAVNLALNQSRRVAPPASFDRKEVAQVSDDAPGPERAAIANDEIDRALVALHNLPFKTQQVFLAKWRDDKGVADIAAEFNLHRRSVQKKLAEAEKFLRKKLMRPKS